MIRPDDMASIDDLLSFLDASPSPAHAVESTATKLTTHGYAVGDHRDVDRGVFAVDRGAVHRDGAIIAWSWPDGAAVDKGATFVGAHTDSPCLKLKPRQGSKVAGCSLLEVELYGGLLLNSWLDRDLGIAGVVYGPDGGQRKVLDRRPIARIPQLAIHLDREVNEKGLVLGRQSHMRPIWALDEVDFVKEILGVEDPARSSFEVVLFDVNPAALVGQSGDMIASGRLDNLVSCWAATDALVNHVADRPMIVCLFDHEEVGSESTTGAAGPMLESIVDELLRARGEIERRFEFARASLCISADNAHALHPNYIDRHDPNHAPLINRGPALKSNANQRYATSSRGAAHVRTVARNSDLPLQEFVSNNAMPCGSTIGPITATRMGIETVDIGVPQLAMHSARETCGADDPIRLRNLISRIAASSFA